jgi:ribosomal-protein-alanine N-acetyltransferase
MSDTPDVEQVRIEPATPADLDEIMVIERASFSAPWTAESIAEEIARPWSIFRVLRNGDGQLCAYLNFWVIYDELHILNIATHREHRRCGYARALMEELLAEAERNAVTEIMLEVRRTNEEAQRLYESLAFVRIGVRSRYYSDRGEDAIVYARRIGSDAG